MLLYNLKMLWDCEEKRELFEYLGRLSAERLLDSFDTMDIYREIMRREGNRMYGWNAYMLAAEFYGEMANYSTSDIKMLRRLSM
jgi:hypothetical protein